MNRLRGPGTFALMAIALAPFMTVCHASLPASTNPFDPFEGIGIILLTSTSSVEATNVFAAGADLNDDRTNHRAVALNDSSPTRVLVAGGSNNETADDIQHRTAEIYDENAGTFTATGSMSTRRDGLTMNLLPDGRVLVTGGSTGATCHGSAELYDPTAATFSNSANTMTTCRTEHQAVLLNDNNRVLIMGGSESTTVKNSAELYNITMDTFTATANPMATARRDAAAILLNDGKVLITGGRPDLFGTGLNTAELYDPGADNFTATTGNMISARYGHRMNLLSDGRVLIIGGRTSGSTLAPEIEIYDPTADTFSKAADLDETARGYELRVTPLAATNASRFLITGGRTADNFGNSLNSGVIFDADTSTFSTIDNTMTQNRSVHEAVLLSSGRVLIIGGVGGVPTSASAGSSEIYRP